MCNIIRRSIPENEEWLLHNKDTFLEMSSTELQKYFIVPPIY